jgi:23S rRNA (uracil1939-C5)-methyltransferase
MCGGCSLQHVQEDKQILIKQEQLLDLLARYGRSQPEEILPPLLSKHWHYRNKARLSVRFVEKKGTTMVGFRERNNPRYITEINQCPVLNAKVDADLVHLRELVDHLDDRHSIAQIEVAAGDEDIALIVRHLNPMTVNDAERIKQFANEFNYTVFLQPGGPDSIHLFYPEQASSYLKYSLTKHDITFQFHPTDFTQVNAELNSAMVDQALKLLELKSTDIVLDLFCGLGNFTLPMARQCKHVVGIEGSKTMVDRAHMNARNNQIENVEFYAANLDDEEEVSCLANRTYHKVLIDPPRSGALEIVRQMDKINPDSLVYVSCNPVTLARDTDILVNQKGYRLIKAGVMDMFPHTTHVESIAFFKKE